MFLACETNVPIRWNRSGIVMKWNALALSFLFPSEVSRYLSPLLCFPFHDWGGIGILAQPLFGTLYQFEKFFRFGFSRQFCLASLLLYPVDGIHAVTVDGHIESFLFQQGKPVNDGKELTDIVCAVHRAEVKYFLPACHVYTPVLPLQAASTARLFSTTQAGRGASASLLGADAAVDARLIYSYGEDAKAFSASSRVSNDLYFAPS